MTDNEEGVTQTEFFSDIALRLIEGDLIADRAWRIAFILEYVVNWAVAQVAEDGGPDGMAEAANDLLTDIVNFLLYAHLEVKTSENDIDTQAQRFTEMLERAEEIRKNKNTQNDQED